MHNDFFLLFLVLVFLNEPMLLFFLLRLNDVCPMLIYSLFENPDEKESFCPTNILEGFLVNLQPTGLYVFQFFYIFRLACLYTYYALFGTVDTHIYPIGATAALSVSSDVVFQ